MNQGNDHFRNSRPPKAYTNIGFLKSPEARTIRMLCEYHEPKQRFEKYRIHDTVVIFGSSRARPLAEVRKEYEELLQKRRQHKGRLPPRELDRQLEQMRWKLELARYYDEAMELSRLITEWSKTLGPGRRFVVCSGGGPGVMEAANRGATELAGGVSVGLAISLPAEEHPNPYITPELAFDFHYFFMRKLWFVYMAAALIVFPGGFGTFDELFECLTLVQTRKIGRPLPIIIYGTKYWKDVLDFKALVRWGTISERDLELFRFCDSPKEAFNYLRQQLTKHYLRPVH